MKNYVNMKFLLVRNLKTATNRLNPGHQDSLRNNGTVRQNRDCWNVCTKESVKKLEVNNCSKPNCITFLPLHQFQIIYQSKCLRNL